MIVGGGGPITSVMKSYWTPLVDDFALLQLEKSFRFDVPWAFDCATLIVMSYGNNLNSPPKRRFAYFDDLLTGQPYCTMVVPFWNIIIDVDGGTPIDMRWDDDCSLCDSDHCIDGNCAVDITACTIYGGDTNCDIKVYVAWAGTDADGFYFTSQDRTLSSFRQWSITGAFNSATNFLPNTLPTVDDTGTTTVGSNPSNYGK